LQTWIKRQAKHKTQNTTKKLKELQDSRLEFKDNTVPTTDEIKENTDDNAPWGTIGVLSVLGVLASPILVRKALKVKSQLQVRQRLISWKDSLKNGVSTWFSKRNQKTNNLYINAVAVEHDQTSTSNPDNTQRVLITPPPTTKTPNATPVRTGALGFHPLSTPKKATIQQPNTSSTTTKSAPMNQQPNPSNIKSPLTPELVQKGKHSKFNLDSNLYAINLHIAQLELELETAKEQQSQAGKDAKFAMNTMNIDIAQTVSKLEEELTMAKEELSAHRNERRKEIEKAKRAQLIQEQTRKNAIKTKFDLAQKTQEQAELEETLRVVEEARLHAEQEAIETEAQQNLQTIKHEGKSQLALLRHQYLQDSKNIKFLYNTMTNLVDQKVKSTDQEIKTAHTQEQAAQSVQAVLLQQIPANQTTPVPPEVEGTPDTQESEPTQSQKPEFTAEQYAETKAEILKTFFPSFNTLTESTILYDETNQQKKTEQKLHAVEQLENCNQLFFGDLNGDITMILNEAIVGNFIQMDKQSYEVINDNAIDNKLSSIVSFCKDIIKPKLKDLYKNPKKYRLSEDETEEYRNMYYSLTYPLDLHYLGYANKALTQYVHLINDNSDLYILASKYSYPNIKQDNEYSNEELVKMIQFLHNQKLDAARNIKWVPSDRKIMLCGDIINDRGVSDELNMLVIETIRQQARTQGNEDPFVITASNHDLGILGNLQKIEGNMLDTDTGKTEHLLFELTGYTSDKIAILSDTLSRNTYFEYLKQLKLFHYDEKHKLLLTHCNTYPDIKDIHEDTPVAAYYEPFDVPGEIVQSLFINKLPNKEIQTPEQMLQMVDFMNNYLVETIELIEQRGDKTEIAERISNINCITNTRPTFQAEDRFYDAFKYKHVVEHIAHGHNTSGILNSIIKKQVHYSQSPYYQKSHINIHQLEESKLII
jgi:hypothetical protein